MAAVMMANAKCRSCQAPIRWVRTLPKLNRAPLDPNPDPEGNMWVDHWEGDTPVMGVALNRAAVPRSYPVTYVSHFVTCPEANDWRRKPS